MPFYPWFMQRPKALDDKNCANMIGLFDDNDEKIGLNFNKHSFNGSLIGMLLVKKILTQASRQLSAGRKYINNVIAME